MVASKLRLLRARWITDGSRCHPSPIWKAMFHLFPVFHSAINIEPSSAVPIKRKLHGCSINSSIVSCNFQVNNTITSGILDPTVTQWLHMVCGLWTPGTRCPNVDTMSAFDVSGALRVGKNVVCSMCYCPGGSCIKCRIVNCSIHFHPWCAHQKGLLQSEVEGFDNEKVIFYGRCLLHATNSSLHTGNQSLDVNAAVENPAEQEPTCARTEGYKGCKMGEALRRNLDSEPNDKSGCLVTQEQINA
ncbi:histone H3-lysine(4) N-trimethyltransferase ATX1-like [Aristolochia californica]|uniref:histone H3-lysine(4) N-trimethyltransferase ATX1-like n=1 Tax=Aristolochia californica TaxID=171875 RepID=UPI0035E1A69C